VAKYSGRLAKPPIVYAICQIRFPTVGAIDENRAGAIHSGLREQYPHRTPQNIVELPMLSPGATQTPTLRQAWFLYDRRKTSGYVIEPANFAYRTTAYIDFEHFVAEAMRGLRRTIEVLGPALIDRIGLRFVDLIEGSSTSSLDRFLEPPLLGYKPHIEGFKPQINQQIVAGKTAQGDILFRFSRARHTASVPAELMDPTINGLRVPQTDQESAIIDIDHFKDNTDLDPKPEELESFIRELQGPMSTLFKDAVTPFACEQWNSQ